MTAELVPDWLRPPPDGFTADDLDRIPGLPPHTELIDGSLILTAPQNLFHMTTTSLLEAGLVHAAPKGMLVARQMTVTLARRQRPEPDLAVMVHPGPVDLGRTSFDGDDVVLAVEVVSRESELRDRHRKPTLYAEAGIAQFWLVEQVDGQAVVDVHALDPATGAYVRTGRHRGRLTVGVPFPIDLDLTEIDRL